MRILLVLRVPPYFDQFRANDEVIPARQFQVYWLQALKRLGQTVRVFRYTDSVVFPNDWRIKSELGWERRWTGSYHKFRQVINRGYRLNPENWVRAVRLWRLIKSFRPEIIIVGSGVSELVAFPFWRAKARGVKLALLSGEDPLNSATAFERQQVKLFDIIVANDPVHAQHWLKLKARRALAVPYAGIEPAVHRKYELTSGERGKFGSDVVFIGSLLTDRQKILAQLVSRFRLRVFGYLPPRVELLAALRQVYGGEAWGKEAAKIYNGAKMAINFVPKHMPIGGNLRTFEIPGCGTVELAERCKPEWYQDRREVFIFRSLEELIKLTSNLLDQPDRRKLVAEAGYRRTQREHTYGKRFGKIIDLLRRVDEV